MNTFNIAALILLAACGSEPVGTDTADAWDTGGLLELEQGPLRLQSGGFRFIDQDGDGFSLRDDCDDRDARIYPGAPELCDGEDNDCNGVADEGLTFSSSWADTDGDGLGDPLERVESCTPAPPLGYVPNDLDCDDADPGQPVLYYTDADSDGCGDVVPGIATELSCDGAPQGFSATHDDCDDADAAVCAC